MSVSVVSEVTIVGLETTTTAGQVSHLPGHAHLTMRSIDGHLHGSGYSKDRSIVPGDHVECVAGWWVKVGTPQPHPADPGRHSERGRPERRRRRARGES